MEKEREAHPVYIYPYACHEDERPLCELELCVLLDAPVGERYVRSTRAIDPSRSPFAHGRLSVERRAASLEEIAEAAASLELNGRTFKLRYIEADGEADYAERRRIERLVGARFRGKAEMKRPECLYGLAYVDGEWLLGDYTESESVWLRHNDKPRHYSTALGTRTARAIANIAVPKPENVHAVDPCCGIGTVLIEAKSMGIRMDGFDLNPLAAIGARENLAFFGLPGDVVVADMRKLEGRYDALVLDLPYNLCSVLTVGERLEMLSAAERLAGRCVIVATEDIEAELAEAGMKAAERCVVRKGNFARYVWLCVRPAAIE
ncbi:RNA methyltransferase [Saccharibacillus sp. O23]|uniref:TRM11 family SAM-dependent methyltransferase n=1 Tax=Saccharibacillus sp. O23 TaxID=2009338 RepID=UPI000B4E242E|nr:RNA methyltransferase [Saccharibacillus sp. O23]OWR32969.1 RNA methyltransferase [Saccharibacillus sp. O23]